MVAVKVIVWLIGDTRRAVVETRDETMNIKLGCGFEPRQEYHFKNASVAQLERAAFF